MTEERLKNRLIDIRLDNTPNPTYGPMGRKITPNGWDSLEMQYRRALIRDKSKLVYIPVKQIYNPVKHTDSKVKH